MKVLILSAATGGGHKQASNALANVFIQKDPNAIVRVVDAPAYCGHFFDKTISGGYHFLATKTPALYGKFYRITDKETSLNSMVGIVNDQLSKRLFPLFNEFEPDIVISCHPFVTEMVARLKEQGLVKIPFISILTDFSPHRTYIRGTVDAYIVASDEMIDMLEYKYGVPKEKIHSLGIPINPAFYQEKNKEQIISDLGFNKDLPTILIMAGSFGVTDILDIYENITKIKNDFQIIVITGKNKKLYDAFDRIINTEHKDSSGESEAKKAIEKIREQVASKLDDTLLHRLVHHTLSDVKPTKLFYFVDNVGDYMAVSDLIITKPGGLTVSESLASALPLLIFDAIPGQETDNADYLVRNNMAIKLSKGVIGADQIRTLLEHPEKLEEMRENCRKHFKDRSAEHIYSLVKEITEAHKTSTHTNI